MPADILRGLDRTPSQNAVDIWADYVEMRCILHPDGYFTIDTTQEAEEESADYSAGGGLVPAQEIDSALSAKWGDLNRQLRRRQSLFGDQYPFESMEDVDGIQLKDGWEGCGWYLFQLLASSLQYIPNARRNDVTHAFELVSFLIFKSLHAIDAEVHGFWANGGGRYALPTLPDKLTRLARDIRATPIFDKWKDFRPNDRGDGGIDLVAWHGMHDLRDRVPVAIGQCGCSVTEWSSKPAEIGREKISPLLHIPAEWHRYFFSPLCFTGGNKGKWCEGKEADIAGVVFVDRFRIVKRAESLGIQLPPLAEQLLTEMKAINYH
ncbi:hypothetical protein [Aquitalea sp. FJL05]|uniref:hypothetical protein n=1 Tax=Aquitalea sp. FJL05 TaxID=2153366 RepID=UPI000F5AB77D|nr:hypothetical protein [Aquitalea sp. FJL05]